MTEASSPPPVPTPSPTPAQQGSVYCDRVEIEVCLEAIASTVEAATIPFPNGAAAIVKRDCEVCFACVCPMGYFEVWAPSGWRSVKDLTVFHAKEHDDPATGLTITSEPPGTLAPFMLPAIPRGGPWTGRYVANRLHITFVPGTSPADASAFAASFNLTNAYSDSDTINRSTFGVETDAPATLNEIASQDVVCAAGTFSFDGNFVLAPVIDPPACTVSELALHVDGRAKVTEGGVVVRANPAADAPRLQPRLPIDTLVYVIAGPVRIDGLDWWQVLPREFEGEEWPLGWVPTARQDESATLEPARPDCLPLGVPQSAHILSAYFDPLDNLACFGGQELAFEAVVDCTAAQADPAVGGADWIGLDCHADGEASVAVSWSTAQSAFGSALGHQLVSGLFQVRGHFHDPQADNCFSVPFGTVIATPNQPREIGAVLSCRQQFVLTDLEPRPLSDVVGRTQNYEMYVDCTRQSVNYAGARWIPDPASLSAWTPADQHLESGWIELVSEMQAKYRGPFGGELLLNRSDDPLTPACPVSV